MATEIIIRNVSFVFDIMVHSVIIFDQRSRKVREVLCTSFLTFLLLLFMCEKFI
jgi:hypothetical protein